LYIPTWASGALSGSSSTQVKRRGLQEKKEKEERVVERLSFTPFFTLSSVFGRSLYVTLVLLDIEFLYG
jgi:hypothetical protein